MDLGARSIVVMPTTTPLIKVERTKGYGAEVILYGDVFDDAPPARFTQAVHSG